MGLTTWISMSQDITTGHFGAIHITHMYLTHMHPTHTHLTPYVPAKIALQATKERLWANKYLNPNSVHSKVQESKERLWAVKNPYYGSQYDYGWRE